MAKNSSDGRAIRTGRATGTRGRVSLDQAIIAVLIAAMDANEHVSREEAWRAHHIIWSMRRFRNRPGENLDRLIRHRSNTHDGTRQGHRSARSGSSITGTPSSFALAVDLMLADAKVESVKKRFVKQLAVELKIQPGLADDLIRAMVTKKHCLKVNRRGRAAARSLTPLTLGGPMQTETSYLGMRLEHPFIAGASPLGYRVDTVKRLEDAGCAAVVLHSLFEEQITFEQEERIAGLSVYDREFAEVFAEFPESTEYPLQPDEYAEHIRRVKDAAAIPVISSLNGRTKESWLKFAKVIEQAGADALEPNMYQVVTDLGVPSAQVESRLVGIVEESQPAGEDSYRRHALAVLHRDRQPRAAPR